MERRLLAFSTLKLAQPTESANAEKEVLMKWVTVLDDGFTDGRNLYASGA
jgi:hypothetical protein